MNDSTRRILNEAAAAKIAKLLEEKGLTHLRVRARGVHLSIYSTDEDENVNRARLTRLSSRGQYQLGIADHRGRWEATPYTGTIPELVELLTEQFGFVLTDY